MNPSLRELIDDAAEIAGTPRPQLLEADQPIYSADATSVYYIGVIGGKDVGKSSLVNALAGAAVAEVTSHGEGTSSVLAYAHRSRCGDVLDYLRENVDAGVSVVPHDLPHLINQVLLDLPDIDSLHDSHIVITRRALRHLLFPIWAQSIEKYADLAPRQLLAKVAQGNDPANFLFVLTKADQVRGDGNPLTNLRDDYARRISGTLQLTTPPRVFLSSAKEPSAFDLPALRDLLNKQKATQSVEQAIELAGARRDQSVLQWFDHLQLDEKANRLARLEEDARERIVDRIGQTLLDPVISSLRDDPGPRGSAADEALGKRSAQWPIVGLVHISLAPISVMLRRFASPPATTSALVDSHLPSAEISAAIQTTFAHLEATYPGLSVGHRGKLWESMPADLAVGDLRRRLIDTLDRQRTLAAEQAGRSPIWMTPFRWIITIGALLWFPLAQPILEAMLQRDHGTTRELALTVVRMLSVAHLLESLTFLIAYFLILYLLIRRSVHRRVARMFARWDETGSDESISLSMQAGRWISDLTAGIADERDKLDSLVKRADTFRAARRI